jgi:hypothetical protein
MAVLCLDPSKFRYILRHRLRSRLRQDNGVDETATSVTTPLDNSTARGLAVAQVQIIDGVDRKTVVVAPCPGTLAIIPFAIFADPGSSKRYRLPAALVARP